MQGQLWKGAEGPRPLEQRTHAAVSSESYSHTAYTWDASEMCTQWAAVLH